MMKNCNRQKTIGIVFISMRYTPLDNRRKSKRALGSLFLTILILYLMSWGGSLTGAAGPAQKKNGVPKPPNIVMVIGDDHGVYHSSPYGAKEIHTPHMQAMAEEGMTFGRAYVASPTCAPSRAALFTGLMPYRNGIVGNHEINLKPGVKSLASNLIERGYEMIWRGKVGHKTQQYCPREVIHIKGATEPLDISGVEKYIITRRDKSRPLAIFIGCKWPHRPWPQPEKARIAPQDVVVPPKTYDTPETRSEMTRYIEAVESVDRALGQVREMVARHLVPENTLLIYTADHGQAWPFAKWTLYEAGIRTPILAVWPGKIKPGSSTRAMVSWIDMMPTFIDVAGGEAPKGIDGRSFKRVLLGETDSHRDHVFATHKGDRNMNVYPIRAVRTEQWKYILNLHPEFYYTTHMDLVGEKSPYYNRNWPSWIEAAQTDPAAAAFLRAYHSRPEEELYRVEKDPCEKNNLAGNPEYQETLDALRAMVRNRMKKVGDDESLSGPPRLLKDHKLP